MDYSSSSGPQVCRDVVMAGSQMTDRPQSKEQPPGDVQAFDVRTGKKLWRWYSVPHAAVDGNIRRVILRLLNDPEANAIEEANRLLDRQAR